MKDLTPVHSLGVKQVREWTEIFTGFETRNKYIVYDSYGNQLFLAAEEKNGFLMRAFLKASRPFTISILENDGQVFLKIVRPFRWIFPECEVVDKNGKLLGKVKWEFSLLKRKYSIMDASGKEIYKLVSPSLKPWTFLIMKDDMQIGVISKKWAGLIKEAFSDVDNFGIEFSHSVPADHKAVLLGSVFLIDFVHFENRN